MYLEPAGEEVVRYSDLSRQHSTAFIELAGNDLHVSDDLLNKIKSKYEPLLMGFLPFNLVVLGPHIAATGGIILEGAVYSQQYFQLREAAASDLLYVPKGAGRGIHEIIHSTIGYITRATSNQMLRLHQLFKSMRSESDGIPIRIREARIIATRNKRLVNDPQRVLFKGKRPYTFSDNVVATALQKIIELQPMWASHKDIKNFVDEEAIYWSEIVGWSRTLHLAQQIIALDRNP